MKSQDLIQNGALFAQERSFQRMDFTALVVVFMYTIAMGVAAPQMCASGATVAAREAAPAPRRAMITMIRSVSGACGGSNVQHRRLGKECVIALPLGGGIAWFLPAASETGRATHASTTHQNQAADGYRLGHLPPVNSGPRLRRGCTILFLLDVINLYITVACLTSNFVLRVFAHHV